MFVKVLKQDLRSIFRIWWIVALSSLGLSVVGALTARGMLAIRYTDDALAGLLSSLGILIEFMCGLAILAAAVITVVLVFWRYYTHFFTDEGYLTFTLPVSRRLLFLSKMINAMIWLGALWLLLIVCALLFLLLMKPSENGFFLNLTFFSQIKSAFITLAEWSSTLNVSPIWLAAYVLQLLLLFVFSVIFSQALVYFCITVGSILAKKAKLITSIGIYYGINLIFSPFSQILVLGGFGFLAAIAEVIAGVSMSMHAVLIFLVLLIADFFAAALAMVMSFITCGLLERKLNLP